MTATLTSQAALLYEPTLLRALRKVARGEIGTYAPTAPLGLRYGDLVPSHLFTALFVLRRDGLVAVGPPESGDGWRAAELTSRGVALLEDWNARLTGTMPRRVRAVGVIASVVHLVDTEDRLPRVLETKDGPVWIALCRAWTHPKATPASSDLEVCGRCASLAEQGTS